VVSAGSGQSPGCGQTHPERSKVVVQSIYRVQQCEDDSRDRVTAENIFGAFGVATLFASAMYSNAKTRPLTAAALPAVESDKGVAAIQTASATASNIKTANSQYGQIRNELDRAAWYATRCPGDDEVVSSVPALRAI
jgi:hypothetical protein